MSVNVPITTVYGIILFVFLLWTVYWVIDKLNTVGYTTTVNSKAPVVCSNVNAQFENFNDKMEYYYSRPSLWSSDRNNVPSDLVKYCNLGYSMIDSSCHTQRMILNNPYATRTWQDPRKDYKFLGLCCNNDENTCNINSVKCMINQSKFINFEKGEGGDGDLMTYCKLGFNVMVDECELPGGGGTYDSKPQTSNMYRNMCCDTMDPSLENCGPKSLTCVYEWNRFLNEGMEKEPEIKDFRPGGEQMITDWCEFGHALSTSGCRRTNPFGAKDFAFACCNKSTNMEDCTSEAMECLFNEGRFKLKANQMVGLINQPNIWYKNKSIIEDLCRTGNDILNGSCNHGDPMSIDTFKSLCCNWSDDPNDCNEESLQCTFELSEFQDKIYSMDLDAKRELLLHSSVSQFASRNYELVESFCRMGVNLLTNCEIESYRDKGLISSTTNGVNPLDSVGFREFCCNGKNDKAECSAELSSCTVDEGKFSEYDSQIKVMYNNDSPYDLSSYCEKGISLMENNCNFNPITDGVSSSGDAKVGRYNPSNLKETMFDLLCCAGSTDKTRCTMEDGYQCTSLIQKFNSQQKIIESTSERSLSDRFGQKSIAEFCETGRILRENKCNFDPYSSTYEYRCCNGNRETCI